MKIKRYLLLAASVVSLTACNMDLFPDGAIDMNSALESVEDAQKFSNRTYSLMRSLTSGGFVSVSEIQSDQFNASRSFGNNGGVLYQWTWSTNEGEIESVWASSYVSIQHANFMIEKIGKMDKSELTPAELKELNQYKGEAHFLRAFCYSILAEKYCQAYDPATAETTYGAPIVDEYAPTSDQSKYPGRSTLAQTYKKILDELDSAKVYVTRNPAPDSQYLTTDAVKGLRARVLLYMKDYKAAADQAAEIISTNKYQLIDDATKFISMWTNDNGNESIMQFYASMENEELPSSSSYGYLSVNNGVYTSMYIPTKESIAKYDQANDIRFKAYFANPELDLSGVKVKNVYTCNKFPGNPKLTNGEPNNINCPKFLRIAEMYLIAAEGYGEAGDLVNASKYLNDLKTKRIKGYQAKNFASKTELLTELRNERFRELYAEGFRMVDLKRWNMDLDRGTYQDATSVYLPDGATTTALKKEAGDPRFVWPLPKYETDSNPKLKAQQNPGY